MKVKSDSESDEDYSSYSSYSDPSSPDDGNKEISTVRDEDEAEEELEVLRDKKRLARKDELGAQQKASHIGNSSQDDNIIQKSGDLKSISNNRIALSTPTVNNKRISQKEELAKASQASPEPEWLKRALKPRNEVLQELEKKRANILEENSPKEPEWLAKYNEQKQARDLKGLERFLHRKAPELPPEPEWIQKAHLFKRRDNLLLSNPEKVHHSNKEAPEWVNTGASKKILSSFLRQDVEVIPDWMNREREMNKEERSVLISQLENLRQLLEIERNKTREKLEQQKSLSDILIKSKELYHESHSSYSNFKHKYKRRKGEKKKFEVEEVQKDISNMETIFANTKNYLESVTIGYSLVVPPAERSSRSRSKSKEKRVAQSAQS